MKSRKVNSLSIKDLEKRLSSCGGKHWNHCFKEVCRRAANAGDLTAEGKHRRREAENLMSMHSESKNAVPSW